MENIGTETVSGNKQYLLYYVYYCIFPVVINRQFKNMPRIYYPTLEMTNNVREVLLLLIKNFHIENQSVVVGSTIGKSIFTKINDHELMNAQEKIVNIFDIVERSEELMKYKYHGNLQKNYYDEYMLAVLRQTGLIPRIKREGIKLNPFKNNYIETDEKTIREMGLVIKD